MTIADDDSLDFPAAERAYVRSTTRLGDWDWVRRDAPSPRHRLRLPLERARVGLVSTAGAHAAGTPPLGAGGRALALPLDAGVTLTHGGYDTERAAADPEVVYPVRTLERLAAAGSIGAVAGSALSTMGGALIAERVVANAVPTALAWAGEEQLDLALLVPA